MATIRQLLIQSEEALKQAKVGYEEYEGYLKTELDMSMAASLLAIARSLNHIIDHGVGPGTLPMLETDEEIKR